MTGAVFPFTAIVGQEQLKLALLLNVVDPGIGGVLIRGGKGTAKSTAVRGLAEVMPPVEVTAGCPFSCAPAEATACPGRSSHREARPELRPARVVTLPVGASEERLVGSLNIEAALTSGSRVIEPGLLAAAHRGVLYVDEVNLLADHLVDALLDAAAMGRNYIERDGISASHPARFVLVGTMNPEEGELRPQLLDRFGLMAAVDAQLEPALRAEVVRRRIAFDEDPEGFRAAWASEQAAVAGRLAAARAAAPTVDVPGTLLDAIVAVCAACGAEGMRADLVLYRAARARAAWEGRDRATLEDVRVVAPLVLAHRQRRLPFEPPELDMQRIDEALQPFEDDDSPEPPGDDGPGRPPAGPDRTGDGGGMADAPGEQPGDAPADAQVPPAAAPVGREVPLRAPAPPRARRRRGERAGRRVPASGRRGRHIGDTAVRGRSADIDIAATLRHAAARTAAEGGVFRVATADLRARRRLETFASLVVMVIDASGSMGARRRMEAAKGAVLSLLRDAYRGRDRVALVAFHGQGARVLLAPTRSVDHAHRALAEFGTGGRTPLAAGLEAAALLVHGARRREPGLHALLVLVTDGRANAAPAGLDPVRAAAARAEVLRSMDVDALVVDTEQGPVRLGIARALARQLGGEHVRLEELEAGALRAAVRARLAGAAR